MVGLNFALAPCASAREWPHPGNDAGGMRHSPLKQIDRSNVKQLEPAWTFDTGDWSDGTELPSRSSFAATPLVIEGVLYVPSPFSRLFALDAETGRQLWVFDPEIDKSVRRNLYVNRGVSSWTDGKKRLLLLGDIQGRLWAIDAATGRPDPGFGTAGRVDLRAGMADGFPEMQYGLTSPVAVCGDVLVAGALVSDGAPRRPSGDVRGLDARTGRVLWRFHTVPRPGEAGHETWEGDSWKDRGGTNAWSFMSVDEKRRLVFLPLTSPAYDFFGGDRGGANLYGNSVVALDCATGTRRWHFQTVHHDVWDYDLPAAPVLVTVKRNGKDVPAVAQVTKTGFVFVLHRETGEPLFPVEERPFLFGHREHLAKGATCAECHGPVETREALRKEVSTGMNACLACHRRTQAPVHCAACHSSATEPRSLEGQHFYRRRLLTLPPRPISPATSKPIVPGSGTGSPTVNPCQNSALDVHWICDTVPWNWIAAWSSRPVNVSPRPSV